MKKEVLIAIIIGFGLGLVITFGLWIANKNLVNKAPETPAPVTQETPIPEPSVEFFLKISSPENNFLTDQETMEIKGLTGPKSIIVILYPEGEKIFEADEKGNFVSEIDLTGGVNEIKISSYDQTGNEAQETITVVYSTAEI